MALSLRERLTSLKTGVISACSAGFVYLLSSSFNQWIRQTLFSLKQPFHDSSFLLPIAMNWTDGLEGLVMAVLSGFLFGVTYRYVLRGDRNPHLRTGAIAAFGLVRGLAELEMGLMLHQNFWLMLLLVGESMGMMTIAAFSVDWATRSKWIEEMD